MSARYEPPAAASSAFRQPFSFLNPPDTEWLKGTVALSPRGEIIIDDRGQTSVPGVYAAGDSTTVPYKHIVVAMGAGSTAALSAFDHLMRTAVLPQAQLETA